MSVLLIYVDTEIFHQPSDTVLITHMFIFTGIPQRLRFDPGVENGMTADLQVLLASLANGEEDCVRFGKSTANQVIGFFLNPMARIKPKFLIGSEEGEGGGTICPLLVFHK